MSRERLTRREFLKLAGGAALGAATLSGLSGYISQLSGDLNNGEAKVFVGVDYPRLICDSGETEKFI